MNQLGSIVRIETRKALRSRMPLFTAMGFMIMPLVSALFLFITKNPDLSRKLGLISAKAELLAFTADWPGYLMLTAEMSAIGGLFVFCIVFSWIFGREFADHTLKDLLAVPVRRWDIVMGKFIVAAVWAGAITLLVSVVELIIGAAMGLPQGSPDVIASGMRVLVLCTILAILVSTPFALLASYGRGYLLPLGIAIIAVILANVAAVLGWADYFPWAIPGLLSQGIGVGFAGYALVVLTSAAGILGTYAWWMLADQSR